MITVVEFVELIRGKVLVYRVVDSEFSLHDDRSVVTCSL